MSSQLGIVIFFAILPIAKCFKQSILYNLDEANSLVLNSYGKKKMFTKNCSDREIKRKKSSAAMLEIVMFKF